MIQKIIELSASSSRRPSYWWDNGDLFSSFLGFFLKGFVIYAPVLLAAFFVLPHVKIGLAEGSGWRTLFLSVIFFPIWAFMIAGCVVTLRASRAATLKEAAINMKRQLGPLKIMKPTEIKDLVTGLLVLIFAAVALGQYGSLQKFARVEAAKALHPQPVRAFFPGSYFRN